MVRAAVMGALFFAGVLIGHAFLFTFESSDESVENTIQSEITLASTSPATSTPEETSADLLPNAAPALIETRKKAVATPTALNVSSPFVPQDDNVCTKLALDSPFWYDPDMQSARVERQLRAEGRHEEARMLRTISCVPQAFWLNNSPERQEMLKAALIAAVEVGKTPVIVLYNSPAHETAEWNSGIKPGAEYREWVFEVAKTVAQSDAIIIIEPDALPLAAVFSDAERARRVADITAAVDAFASHAPRAHVYLDAGHNAWKETEKIAAILKEAGVEHMRGFSLNIANYRSTEDSIRYGEAIAKLIPGSHFVIDTGRNGSGNPPEHEWCNAPDQALGYLPQRTAHETLDALLWIKPPGESDGYCNGGPAPGKFWLEYALTLANNAL